MTEKIEKFQVLIVGLIIAIASVFVSSIIVSAISKNTITVTGSYSQNVTSDTGSFEFELKAYGATKALAYNLMNKQRPTVIKYLKEQGFEEKDIEIKAMRGYDVY